MTIGLFITFYSFVSDANLNNYYQILFAFVGTLVSVLIGFFVAAACGYMAGLVGSSSSPISGIGLIGIIVSSLVILLLGANLFDDPMLSKFAIALAIFTTSVIVATAAISNDNLQDLKTGYLVGATPWKQQVALLIGCVFGAMPREGMDLSSALAAPQANLMSTIAQGIFNHNYQNNSHKNEKIATHEQKGTLFASGLIVGESIFGVIIAAITVFSVSMGGSESPLKLSFLNIHNNELLGLIFFIGVILYFIKRIVKIH